MCRVYITVHVAGAYLVPRSGMQVDGSAVAFITALCQKYKRSQSGVRIFHSLERAVGHEREQYSRS